MSPSKNKFRNRNTTNPTNATIAVAALGAIIIVRATMAP
jgi:hypothetical protein